MGHILAGTPLFELFVFIEPNKVNKDTPLLNIFKIKVVINALAWRGIRATCD
jgi:hypothetical protein